MVAAQLNDPQSTLSDTLRATAHAIEESHISLRQMLALVGEQGMLLFCVLLTVPFLLPVSIPGVSIPFGLLILFIGIGITLNRVPWLPAFLMERRFAAEHLKALLASPHQIIAVYTQPDRPAGRGQKLMPSPVKQLAVEHGIAVYQPASLRNEEAQAELAALKPDLMVVVAYGLILPQVVLDTPRLGCINSHASLLPRWRGAAPIQRAVQAGDAESGVTVMQMEAGLDTGPMLLKVTTPISASDTGGMPRVASITTKSLPRPCIFRKRMARP